MVKHLLIILCTSITTVAFLRGDFLYFCMGIIGFVLSFTNSIEKRKAHD
jgi:hypothetical protein